MCCSLIEGTDSLSRLLACRMHALNHAPFPARPFHRSSSLPVPNINGSSSSQACRAAARAFAWPTSLGWGGSLLLTGLLGGAIDQHTR